MTTPMTMRVVPMVGGPPGGPGQKGDNGQNLRIDNTVSTASALPGTPPEGEGAVYSVTDESALYQWTEDDGWTKAADLQGPAGQGVPAGGTEGQVATKASGDDYDVQWATPLKLGTGSTDAMPGDTEIPSTAADVGAVALAAGIVVVDHDDNPDVARPAGAKRVLWFGTVEPTNATERDMWADTTEEP